MKFLLAFLCLSVSCLAQEMPIPKNFVAVNNYGTIWLSWHFECPDCIVEVERSVDGEATKTWLLVVAQLGKYETEGGNYDNFWVDSSYLRRDSVYRLRFRREASISNWSKEIKVPGLTLPNPPTNVLLDAPNPR